MIWALYFLLQSQFFMPAAQARDLSVVIVRESERRHLDPLLVFSVIRVESRFSTNKLGHHGEIGLMQLKPSTARWIADKTGLAWRGRRSLFDPTTNIRLGTAYLSLLRDEFKASARLYLTAYNMGGYGLRRAIA